MTSPKPPDRRGVETVRRYGGDFIAQRARDGLIRRRLDADGLDPQKMKPEDLAAYRTRVMREQAAKARAALALKNAVIRAEREAEAAAKALEAARAAFEAKDGTA